MLMRAKNNSTQQRGAFAVIAAEWIVGKQGVFNERCIKFKIKKSRLRLKSQKTLNFQYKNYDTISMVCIFFYLYK
jgi:hypothetical protein